jgi:hypothetical protein
VCVLIFRLSPLFRRKSVRKSVPEVEDLIAN